MSKYTPLEIHLRKLRGSSVSMTFDEIENIIGAKLPPSADIHRAWWSNNPSNGVITQAWLNAGYKSADVDMKGRKLVFRKSESDGLHSQIENQRDISGADNITSDISLTQNILRTLMGTVTLMPGTDLTSPTGEKWNASE
jgi:hypothetical protein